MNLVLDKNVEGEIAGLSENTANYTTLLILFVQSFGFNSIINPFEY